MDGQIPLFKLNYGAAFSPGRKYRYALWRTWDKNKPIVLFIGLNPSTADETKNDPTIRRCINFAKSWGFGGICMANLFAFRATKPPDMKQADDPIGPDNDKWLKQLAAEANGIVACWGTNGKFKNRDKQVKQMLPAMMCFGTTQCGNPKHPLYIPGNKKLENFT